MCLSSCPLTYYPINSKMICQACMQNCDTCSNMISCSFCSLGFFWNGTACAPNCSVGLYEDSASRTCEPCPLNCTDCLSPTYCLSCKPAFFFSNNLCPTSCPIGSFKNNINRTCDNCIQNCDSCLQQTGCTLCSIGFYFNGTHCVPSCGRGTFPNNAGRICQPCPVNCSDCSGLTTCFSCNSGYYLTGNLCLQACPAGFYENATNGDCQSCIANCDDCSDDQNCLWCNVGFFWDNSSCSTSCSKGFYPDTASRKCLKCPNNCTECSNSTFCQACHPGYFFINNTCPAKCPLTYYGDPASGNCERCMPDCDNCTSNASCSFCSKNYRWLNISCVDKCPEGTYPDDISRICVTCPINCTTCYSDANCSKCNTGYFTFGVLCPARCPLTTYENTTSMRCISCMSNCDVCNDTRNCSLCSLGFTWTGTKCDKCPPGKYSDPATRVCLNCPTQCANCTSPTTCQNCSAGFFLHNSSCSSSCLDGYFPNNRTRTCDKCLANCDLCKNSISCDSCSTSYLWTGTNCDTTCPVGTYLDPVARACPPCHSNCSECEGPTRCTACKSNYFLSLWQCPSTCPTKQYGDTATNICEPCPLNCDRCLDGYTCTFCSSGYLLHGSDCITTCPKGNYPDISNRICPLCSSNCTDCTSIGSCKSCQHGTFLQNGYCVQQCSLGWYGNETASTCTKNCSLGFYGEPSSRICRSCDLGCISCAVFGSCVLCTNPRESPDGSCSCPPGSRLNQDYLCQSISIVSLRTDFNVSSEYFYINASLLQEEMNFTGIFNATWSVNTNESEENGYHLRNYLANQTGFSINISYKYFKPAIFYYITCSYKNLNQDLISNTSNITFDFLNGRADYPRALFVSQRSQVQIIKIKYPNLIYKIFEDHYLLNTSNHPSLKIEYFSDYTQLKIPSCFFAENESKKLKFSNYFDSNSLFSLQNEILFSTSDDKFSLAIQNAVRYHPANLPLTLEVSIIFEGVCPDSTYKGITFNWTCISKKYNENSFTKCNDPINKFGNPSLQSSLDIPNSYFRLGDQIYLTLTANNGQFSQKEYANISITGNSTLILSIVCSEPPCIKYPSNTELKLQALIQNDLGLPLKFIWIYSPKISSSSFSNILVLKDDVSNYKNGKLSIFVSIDDTLYSGKAYLELPISTPPQNGSLVVYPKEGISLFTKFTAWALDWTDVDLPLTYKFYFHHDGEEFGFSPTQIYNNATTMLAAVIPFEQITISCLVKNFYGAWSRPTFNVTVYTELITLTDTLEQVGIVQNEEINATDVYVKTIQNAVVVLHLINSEKKIYGLRENISYCMGCPKGEKICDFGDCLCLDPLMNYLDCTISSSDIEDMITQKNQMIRNLTAFYRDLSMNGTNLDSFEANQARNLILTDIMLLTENPIMLNYEIVNLVSSFLSNVQSETGNYFTEKQANFAANILSNMINHMMIADCNCATKDCKKLENSTKIILKEISSAILDKILPGASQHIISTARFSLSAVKVSTCDLEGLKIKTSSNSPEISFKSVLYRDECSKILSLSTYTFPSNLFNCRDDEKHVEDITIIFIPLDENLISHVQITTKMPNGLPCRNEYYLEDQNCITKANDINIDSQIPFVFKNWNKIAELENETRYNANTIIWINVGITSWVIASIICLLLIKSLASFCIVEYVSTLRSISKSIGTLSLISTISDLSSIYLVRKKDSKIHQAVLVYFKMLLYSILAVLSSHSFKTLNIIPLTAAYFVSNILTRLYLKLAHYLHELSLKKKKFKILLFSLAGYFSIGSLSGYAYLVYDSYNNLPNAKQEIWHAQFLTSISIDFIFCPIALAGLQTLLFIIDLKYVKADSKVDKIIAKLKSEKCFEILGKMRNSSLSKIQPAGLNSLKRIKKENDSPNLSEDKISFEESNHFKSDVQTNITPGNTGRTLFKRKYPGKSRFNKNIEDS